MKFKVDFSRVSDKGASYTEVNQQRPCTFAYALVEGDVVFPQHKQVLCRDFLNDTLVWDDEKLSGKIWGYGFKGPYRKDRTCFYMEDAAELLKNIGKINEKEAEYGVSPTEVYPVEGGKKGSVLVIGDAFWQLTTIHLSWYTQMLRQATYLNLTSLTECGKEKMTEHKGYWLLPKKLKQLQLSIKRNAPSIASMHDLNGFYTQLTNTYIKTTYGEQLKQCDASPAT